MAANDSNIQKPGLGLALLPIVLTLTVLGTQLFYFGDFTPHIPLAFGIAITSLVGPEAWPQNGQASKKVCSTSSISRCHLCRS